MDIGVRLKAERERLKLSQTDFGKLGGAGKTTVIGWERGTAYPNAAFLAAAAAAGLDVQYVITGAPSRDALTPEELMVLEHYRAADKKVRAAAIGALIAGAAPSATRNEQVFHGSVGSVTKVEGDLDQRGIRISVGKKKK